jgi:hypothetical protein
LPAQQRACFTKEMAALKEETRKTVNAMVGCCVIVSVLSFSFVFSPTLLSYLGF